MDTTEPRNSGKGNGRVDSAAASAEAHAKLLRLASRASLAVALILVGAKSLAYQKSASVSVLASLLDSSVDCFASLATLLAVRYALRPADAQHRFGHGKAEALAALLQAALILVACFLLLREALQRLLDPGPVDAAAWGIGVMLFSLLLTSSLLALQRHVVRVTRSVAIKADSLHYQVDLLSNAAVLLAIVLAQAGLLLADPLIAVLIAAYLLYSTWDILRHAIDQLLDRELPVSQRDEILALATQVPDVQGVHGLRTRLSGRTPIIQLHLDVNGEHSLRQAHAIADRVRDTILERFPDADLVTHLDPVHEGEAVPLHDTDPVNTVHD